MITRDYENSIQKLRGLSTDTKPTDVPNGAEFLEMDTGTLYRFNAVNSQWIEQAEGGGGSVSVEPLTATENRIYTAPSGTAYNPVTVAVPEGAETAVVTYTMDDETGTITSDKTFNEINTLINGGAVVVADMISGGTTMRGHLMSSDSSAVCFAFGGPVGADAGAYTIMGIRHGSNGAVAIFPYIVSPMARLEVNFSRSGSNWTCDKTYATIYQALGNNVPIKAGILDGPTGVTAYSGSIDSTGKVSFLAFVADAGGTVECTCATITPNNTVAVGIGYLTTDIVG